MAVVITQDKFDDINPKHPADETVNFGLDGVAYQIDLSSAHAKKLREQLGYWVEYGRRVRKRRKSGRRPSSRAAQRDYNANVRSWAKKNGTKIGTRGRIPDSVLADYQAAQGKKK